MKRRPQATVRVLTLPHIDAEAVRVEVDCRYSTTGLTSIPGPLVVMTRPMLVTSALFAHEGRCGECDTTDAHDQGDQTVRAEMERLSAAVMQRAARRYAESVRN